MLYRLEIENFYSIRDQQIIDLRVPSESFRNNGRLVPLWKGAEESAPKIVAIFGANASGKSNVVKALAFLVWFVKHSFSTQRNIPLPFQKFYDAEKLHAPTRLAMYFVALQDGHQKNTAESLSCSYCYELVLEGGTSPHVSRESLSYWPSPGRRKIRLFTRNGNGAVTCSAAFGLNGLKQVLSKILRPDASAIATLVQLQHPFSVYLWDIASHVVGDILIYKHHSSESATVQHYATNTNDFDLLNHDIAHIDLGIKAMRIEQGVNGPLASFVHDGLTVPVPWMHESEGTKHFLKIYPLLAQALRSGSIAIVDELDATIHPILLPEILRWFQDVKRNPHNAQLWMSCHAVSMLEELTKEEVWFCEKDRSGRTELFGLRDVEYLNGADNFYKKYMGGVFGAVPHIG